MLRTIIKIDKDACNGCGLCVDACLEGAIGIMDGKAALLRDDYCDGLGNCLPACPAGAISFEEREALAYSEESVKANLAAKEARADGCPGADAHTVTRTAEQTAVQESACDEERASTQTACQEPAPAYAMRVSQLAQWPAQIKLVPSNAPFFDGAALLIAADCCAYAYAEFHEHFMKDHITLIGCPKLDEGNYTEKLSEIIRHNNVKSITVTRMEVPCCGGMERMVKEALKLSGKSIPLHAVIIAVDGQVYR